MEKAEPQLLCLRWNNHQSNLVSVFDQLLQNEAFCDVTLAVDGRTVKCHQMVLAASSPYFQGIFMENTCKHPIVFLKDMKYNQIRSLVEYIYYGEAAVPEDELQGLLKIAESLKIKGLVEIEEDKCVPMKEATGPDKPPEKKLVPRKDLHSPGYRTPPNMVVNHEGRIQTPSKEDDAGELIIDEEESMHSDASAPLASNGQAVTPIEVSPEYPGYNSDDTPPAPGMIRVVGANGKAEWKRYKQYTKDDILAAIEEVKAGASALQASRKYGVPSRTLYDKVKKMGILTANMQKQIQQKKPPVPIQPNSNSRSETITPPNTSAPQINFLGLQVPQANLPVVNGIHHNGNASTTFTNGATISTTANPFLPGVTAGVAGVPPISSSLMMSVMSMMSEKLKAGGLMSKNVNENLTNLLKKSSSGSEGSDSGHSSGEPENGDVVIIKEEKRSDDIAADKEKLSSQQQTAQQLISHLVNLNSLAAINTKTPVTLTPRADGETIAQPQAVSPTSVGRASSVITATGSALKRKRTSSEQSSQSSDSQKDINEVKKLLVEPVKQEAA